MVFATFILASLCSLDQQQQSATGVAGLKFQRTYVANSVSTYHFEMEFPGGSGGVKSDIQTSVKQPTPDGAILLMKVLSLETPGLPNSETLPTITTAVGITGMPNKASIRSGEEFFIFLGAASITSGTTIKEGDAVKVHWQNDPKDVVFEGSGKIGKVDLTAKTLTVDWNLTMTPSYTTGGVFKFKSVYSTDDISLLSADGTMTIGGASLKLTVKRKAKS